MKRDGLDIDGGLRLGMGEGESQPPVKRRSRLSPSHRAAHGCNRPQLGFGSLSGRGGSQNKSADFDLSFDSLLVSLTANSRHRH